MEKTHKDLIEEVILLENIKKEMKEQKITKSMMEKSLTDNDLLTIIDKNENEGYTTTIYLNDNKNVKWKYKHNKKTVLDLQNGIGSNYVYKNFPDHLLKLKLTDITIDKNNTEIIKIIKKIIKDIKVGTQSKGLYIYGPEGVGKSYLSIIVLNWCSGNNKKVAHIFLPDFFSNLKAIMSTSGATYKLVDQIKNVDVLLIDDFGSEASSNWALNEILLPIINYRSDSNLTTFITSSYSYDQLASHYSRQSTQLSFSIKKIMSRVKQLTVPIELLGKNKRK